MLTIDDKEWSWRISRKIIKGLVESFEVGFITYPGIRKYFDINLEKLRKKYRIKKIEIAVL